ncbi:MAG: elongation factor G [Ruminococcus sp.]|uniref:elongation factor G n=1 Tax=Ruminococcus sp. TaxID=41978 RepID=UPI0025F7B006|nr:elongation factor G [Ruminococcus sp.]MBR0529599.1 elongation factor G [Ruminococcus sp.]
MKKFDSTKIKNIAIAGHAGSGKTSLTEALLYKSGAVDRLGKVLDGTTVSDYTADEIKRKCSVYTSLSAMETGDLKVNLLDTPGLFDYESGMVEGIFASGCVMITVSAKSGVKVGTHKAYECAKKFGKPTMFVVTKIDDENANFNNVFTQLKTEFGPTVCPVVVPVIADRKIVSYINLIEMKAYKYVDGKAVETEMPTAEVSEKMEYRIDGLIEAVSEAVAETDEELMDKFFSGEAFTQKELIDGIHKGMNAGVITPVTCVSSTDLSGVDMLLKEIDLLLPPPSEKDAMVGENADGDALEVECRESDPLAAFVFKTVADPFVGKMSFIKVFAGILKPNMEVVNATTGNTEKVGKLMSLLGKKQLDVTEAGAGDIVVASKMNVNTNDTICDASRVVKFPAIEFPKPCYKMAVKATKQGDESKISAAISRLLEEDLTLRYELDPSTNEMILSTLGGLHLDSVQGRLKNDFGVEMNVVAPKISYRETIRKKVKVQGRHKKQSGGHGQFGDVWIEFEPCVSDELIFEERVFGGAVPKNFFPAVEKGLQESVKKGVLAGFPVVGLKAILVDGSYHPVDSSEMAFKMAASIAYKEGLRQAEPILLEPIGALNVIVPDDNTGDMMGELNKRRGRVLGMNPTEKHGLTEIVAEVPMAEMQDFTLTLRQMTQGRGSFTFEKVRYEPLPANLVADVIAKNAVTD